MKITKICLTLALAASVSACAMTDDMYDSNVHHGMKKQYRLNELNHGKYEYPPYRSQCPADYRMKGWC